MGKNHLDLHQFNIHPLYIPEIPDDNSNVKVAHQLLGILFRWPVQNNKGGRGRFLENQFFWQNYRTLETV